MKMRDYIPRVAQDMLFEQHNYYEGYTMVKLEVKVIMKRNNEKIKLDSRTLRLRQKRWYKR